MQQLLASFTTKCMASVLLSTCKACRSHRIGNGNGWAETVLAATTVAQVLFSATVAWSGCAAVPQAAVVCLPHPATHMTLITLLPGKRAAVLDLSYSIDLYWLAMAFRLSTPALSAGSGML